MTATDTRGLREAPLSFCQERLWLVDQLVGPSSVYNVRVALRLAGHLDTGALERALSAIVARHDALRVVFDARRGEPVQRVTAAAPLHVRAASVQALPDAQREAEALRLATEDVQRPFDLATGPLVRALLIQLAGDLHLLVLTFHHIVFDGGSEVPLYREIEAFYNASVAGEPLSLEPLPMQFPDFAAWQREQDESATIEYWKRTFAGAPLPPALITPLDRPAGAVPVAGVRSRAFPPAVAEAVTRFCREHETTPFLVHFAAFAAWLARRTGQDDVIAATPMAGRTTPDSQAMIGYFANSVPIRARVARNRSFLALVAHVRDVMLDVYAHQAISAEALLRLLPRRPHASHGSLIPVAFAYEKEPALPRLAGLRASSVLLDLDTAKTDFMITVFENAEHLTARAVFAADLFSGEQVETMLAEITAVVQAAVAHPAATVTSVCALAKVPASARPERSEPRRDPAAVPPAAGGAEAGSPADRQTNLTSAQMALWTAQVMHPGVPLACVPLSMRIRGPLDVAAFGRAFRALVASTDSLRLVIREHDGIPIQELSDDADASLEVVDLRGATDDEIHGWLRRRIGRMPDVGVRNFDSALVALGERDYLWFFNQSHLFVDGRSFAILRDRMSRFYLREIGLVPDAPEHFPSFLEAAGHVRRYQESPEGRADREYFASLLDEDIQPIRFFGVAPEKRTTIVERESLRLDAARLGALAAWVRAIAPTPREAPATVFHLAATLLFAQLHRLTGRRRLSFGAPYYNRRFAPDAQAAEQMKQTTGLFMDVLPVVIEVDPDDSFAAIFEKVRNAWAGAVRHARGGVPADVRVRACDVTLNCLPATDLTLFGMKTAVRWLHPGHEIESLGIQVRQHERTGDVTVHFDFHADVFSPAVRWRLMDQFLRLLDASLADASCRVRDVPLLPEAERALVVHGWNDTHVAGTTSRSVVELFEAQAAQRPDAVALEHADARLQYAEMNERADRFAATLRAAGAGRETLVGLCLPRSIDQIVALFGILKAGAAYLPLDPALPDDRIETVLAGSGTALIVTNAALGARGPFASRQVVTIDGRAEQARPLRRAPSDSRGAPPPPRPGDLAYVIYTSGSTGTPKGVEICHSSLANFTQFARHHFGISEADRVLQFASLSFDTAGEEIFPALAAGATLVLRTDRMLDSADAFLRACADLRLTVVDLPTAYWHTLIDVAAPTTPFPPAIRAVILGGEAVLLDRLLNWQTWAGRQIRLFNGYGPTETTICATYAELSDVAAEAVAGGPVSIGRPVWNAEAFVLDVAGHPVPPGFAGELHVGGAGLSRGYRNDPATTSARFVAHPWRAGDRVYRTGDRVRWRSNGELEYLGRLDQQVKVRGYRVEPGEIEARLLSHPAVREAAVTAQGLDGETRLVAYVAGRGSAIQASDLREYLAARLPAYMIPAVFVTMDALPRNVSGKIDRSALPAPGAASRDAHAEPRTATEAAIAAAWRDLLRLARVGIHDNFFDVGGQSLVGTRLVARLTETLGVTVPLRLLFEHPTIAGLAGAIEGTRGLKTRAAGRGGATTESTAPAPRPATRPIAGRNLTKSRLSFAQERLWLVEQLLAPSSMYNVPLALRLTGRLDAAALEQALGAVVARHDVLRATFVGIDGEPVQRIGPPLQVQLARAAVTAAAAEQALAEALEIASSEVQRPFDLARGPLFRALLVRIGEDDHLLVLTFHHIVFDGWSAAPLYGDLEEFYAAALEKRPSSLPPLAIQYSDFAEWQRDRDDSDTADYWKRALAGAPLPPELAATRERPANAVSHAGVRTLPLPAAAGDAVGRFCRQHDTTPFVFHLSAFLLWLWRRTGQHDLIVSVPVAGRTLPETSPLIGFFVNSLPIRARLEAGEPFAALLARVRGAVLDGYAHQDVSSRALLDALPRRRHSSHGQMLPIAFAVAEAPAAPPQLPGLQAVAVGLRLDAAKSDFTMSLAGADGRLAVRADYATDLFDSATVDGMLGEFARVIEVALGGPNATLEAIAVASGMAASARVNVTAPESPTPGAPAEQATDEPRTHVQSELAAIWRDALRLGRVGIRDNFFDLGGHSLIGTRVVARITAALGVQVPLWLLFEHPTIEALANAIEAQAPAQGTDNQRPTATASPIARRGARQETRVVAAAPLAEAISE